jgi:release factor glutamine methyltransferase
MTLKEALQKAKKELKAIPVDESETSAEFLLRHVLKMERAKFYANLSCALNENEIKEYQKLIERRKKHEPVWQIIGKVEFCALDFDITSDVLIPRPETEFLVEKVLSYVKKDKKLKILDIGTGAGPIIITLAKEIENGLFYGSDISKEALKVAQKNAKSNGVGDKVEFTVGNLFEPWKGQKFDIITANLPYIPHEDLPGLTVEIHHYEPRIALDGGNGGLTIYEEFLKELPKYLNENGMVFCEIGKDQGKLFTNIVQENLVNTKCMIFSDLAGYDRIALIKR